MTIRRRWFAATPVALLVAGAVLAQAPGGGYNVVPAPPRINVQDKEDVWILDFQFKSPRVITVDIPGRGKKTAWYVRYEVWNRTGAPRYFIPDFDLVTDYASFRDEVMPAVQDQVRKIEDPTGFYDVKNSVTIAAKPIPPSKPDANPIYVTGVAVFPGRSREGPGSDEVQHFRHRLIERLGRGPANAYRQAQDAPAQLPPFHRCSGSDIAK